MRALLAIALLLLPTLAHAESDTGQGILAISAPDGPTLETRREIARLSQAGVVTVTVRMENVDLVQDEELLALIEGEMAVLLADRGFAADRITFERCPKACAE